MLGTKNLSFLLYPGLKKPARRKERPARREERVKDVKINPLKSFKLVGSKQFDQLFPD